MLPKRGQIEINIHSGNFNMELNYVKKKKKTELKGQREELVQEGEIASMC